MIALLNKAQNRVFWKRIDMLLTNRLYLADSLAYRQARSQKFAMGGLFWGSGGGAPSAQKFCIFFAKITSF